MTQYTITVSDEYFNLILLGKKKIEGRVLKEKFCLMKAGDILNIINDSKDNTFKTKIIRIKTYDNFIEMLEEEGLNNVAPNCSSIECANQIYHKYFTQDQIKENGVCAIHLDKYSGSSW